MSLPNAECDFWQLVDPWYTHDLCRYYQLMEKLQENLEEHDRLQKLASESTMTSRSCRQGQGALIMLGLMPTHLRSWLSTDSDSCINDLVQHIKMVGPNLQCVNTSAILNQTRIPPSVVALVLFRIDPTRRDTISVSLTDPPKQIATLRDPETRAQARHE